jgi:hypothetical protein
MGGGGAAPAAAAPAPPRPVRLAGTAGLRGGNPPAAVTGGGVGRAAPEVRPPGALISCALNTLVNGTSTI